MYNANDSCLRELLILVYSEQIKQKRLKYTVGHERVFILSSCEDPGKSKNGLNKLPIGHYTINQFSTIAG